MNRPSYVDMIAGHMQNNIAGGGAATVTLLKRAGYRWVLGSVVWGYRTEPTNGLLTISAHSTVVFSMPVASAGAGFTPWMNPRLLQSIADGQNYTIVMADGAVVKDLNVEAWEIPDAQV